MAVGVDWQAAPVSIAAPTTRRAPLPRAARLMLIGIGIDALGVGLVLPFLVIYLHEVRGIPVTTVGILAALPAAIALALLGPLGVLIDRIGPRLVQMGAAVCSLLGSLTLAGATSVPLAALATLLMGVGHAAFWPANQSLVAAVLPSEMRARFFGVSFTLLNAGIGIGGVLGALYVSVDDPSTFTTVYVLDALSFLGPLAILAWPLRSYGGPVAHDPAQAGAPGSYREVLRDKVFRRMLVVVFFSGFVGYGQIEAGWTAFSRLIAEVSTRTIGIAFALNTLVIVVFQLVVLRHIEGRRRTRVLGLLALIWAGSWAIMGLAGLVPGTTEATVLVIASAGIFAFGETLLSPIAPAVTNDLAPERLRGRYNAVNSLAFQLAAITAPVSAGFLIGHDLGAAYVVLLLAGCLAFGVLALRMERWLPRVANGLPADPTGPAPGLVPPAPRLETVPEQA
ncbi:MAG: MFS transporter [Actinomycetes bacterium]